MDNTGRATKASYSFFWMMIFLAITSVCPFILRALIIRVMGIEYAGLTSLFNSVLNVLNLTELGLGEALIFYLYKPMAENDEKRVNELLMLYKKLYFYIGLIILGFSLVLVPFLSFIISGSYPSDINLTVLYFLNVLHTVVTYFCFPYAVSIFQTNQALYYDYRMRSFVWILVYGLQAVIIYSSKNFYFYTLVFFVGNIAFNLFDFLIARKHFPNYHPEGQVDKTFIKELVRKVFAMALGKLRNVCRISVDSIVISAVLGLTILAQYNNYYSVMVIPTMLIAILNKAILQSLGNSVAVESKESNQGVVKLFSFIVQWISIVCSALLICLYKIFMTIWVGEEYTFSIQTEILFVVYFYITQVAGIPSIVRNSTGIWEEGKWFSVIETVFNLVLNIVLVQIFGINGILIATIAALLFFNIPVETKVVYKNYFGIKSLKIYSDYLFHSLVNIGICFISYKLCGLFMTEAGIMAFLVKGVVVFIVANILMVITHLWDSRMWDIIEVAKGVFLKGKTE